MLLNEFNQNIVDEMDLSEEQVTELHNYLSNEGWKYNKKIVSVMELLESPYYMNAGGILYPAIIEAIEVINDGSYYEAVLTGGIGCGKTTIALYSQAVQLYLLSCLKNPQASFGLDPASEIVIVFQSINERTARTVDFERFKTMIGTSPYFREHFMFDKNIESELRFPNRIIVRPVSGSAQAAIGQNVIGGILDEVNFMVTIDKSKRSADRGNYDQALELYNSIARRRKSRFMSLGKLPGILCIVSSKRYPGQFTDQKTQEAKNDPGIYIYDKRVWDIKPDTFSGPMFNVFVGDMSRRPRILGNGESVPPQDKELVTQVPVEYKAEFQKDILNALRDIAGFSTLSVHPFMVNIEAVAACFGTHQSLLNVTETDFEDITVKIVRQSFINPELIRFAHIDLALSGDSAGFAVGHITNFTEIERQEGTEVLPVIHIDCTLEIRPPRNGEIIFSKIRELLYMIKDSGVDVRFVSFDGYQSVDSMQILARKGFMTGLRSMDKLTAPYEMTKSAFYDGRIKLPDHLKLFNELVSLEKNAKSNKIDHPVRGSKDISDALAGVVYGLTTRRDTWWQHEVNPNCVHNSIIHLLTFDKDKSRRELAEALM